MHDYLYLFFLLFLTSTASNVPSYTPTDLILLSSGALSKSKDQHGRTWDTDDNPAFTFSSTHTISHIQFYQSQSSLAHPDIPYRFTRLFYSTETYNLNLNTVGKKFVRLYFSTPDKSIFDASKSFFTVDANGYTLLHNFSAFAYSQYLNQTSFIKEFLIDVIGHPRINLTFSPNPNSFAFINGIEIVSLPDNLYYRNEAIKFVPNQLYYLQNNTALENLYRLNVGGDDVQIQDDTGMFRHWSNDQNYIFGADYSYTAHYESLVINYTDGTPAYTGPKELYTTMRTTANTSKSLEWTFPVDSGFSYLLRFHFYEFLMEITKTNDRVFTINVNNQTAELEADAIFWGNDAKVPIFKDYIAKVEDDGHRGKKELRLSLFPNEESIPKYLSAFLNGLEIFKLSDSNQSLAAVNPILAQKLEAVNPINDHNPGPTELNSSPWLKIGKPAFYVIVIVIGVSALVMTFFVFLPRRWRLRNLIATKTSPPGFCVSLLPDLCRHFSLEEVKMATNNFDNTTVIGRGGFGNVYKGIITSTTKSVAVKRLHASSNQGAQEFLTEIELLSKLRHLHLVSLIGYCDEHGEMILVYDYMAHGTLRDHLYNSNNPPLTWKHRLQICLGAARGLDYLHNGTKHTIIHRDVKSTNILLDEKWVAKMSDFGLSKIFPSDTGEEHISTSVNGSFGYMDPEYYKRRQLTEKSDVYSFGVVLFEVLCARPAILPRSPEPDDQVNLAEWVKLCFQEGKIHEIVDLNLEGQIAQECLGKFVETGIVCLSNDRVNRPSMSEVVRSLELAIQLQCGDDAAAGSSDPPDAGIELTETNAKSVDVFSDLVNLSGR